MITQCPDCNTVCQLSAETLRTTMGMLRWTQCRTVFNALARLRDTPEIQPSPAQLNVPAAAPHAEDLSAAALSTANPTTTSAPGEPRGAAIARALLGQTFSLALRNLARHRRRTALGVAAISCGVVALVLAGGFAEWMQWAERESTIHSRLGHVQIVKRGYYENGVADPYQYLMADNTVPLAQLRALPHVKAVTPRLAFSGLISKGETTVSFMGEGVAPETETEVSKELIVHAGEALSSAAPNGVILGKGLAASLGAKAGDNVVLLTTVDGGSVSAVDAQVRGIFHTAVQAFDEVALRAPIALARQLAKADGVHQFIVLLDETPHTDAMVATLRALLPPTPSGLQIVPWLDLADFYKAVVALFSQQMNFVRTIIAVIIVMSISNTLAMSVMERTSEIGTLMAVGFRRRSVMRLFVSEGLVIGLIGGLGGAALGYVLAQLISAVGIPMPPAPGMDAGFTASILVTWTLVINGFLVAVISAVLASLYPAWKASRLEIVDALRRAR